MNKAIPLQDMVAKSAEAAEFMRLFSTQSRLLLLCFISQNERSVGELQNELDFKQPGLSQQLAELRQAGVVKTRRESRQIYYSIADERVELILKTLYPMFCGPMAEDGTPAAQTPPVTKSADTALGEMAQWAKIEPSAR